ncbi:MerR family transcriptional regulator [Curtobacterium sp. MCLR17_036]|uniref:helix-turn-helix domain-containing protein n=1 Tax=Curtobacterium sp. MCLR17_036 TaxID=2175620 RepID=UPI000DA8F68A|nr:MerR family transcriptional regulator [Curtobacterium sp. MCLR17_036]WIE66160.1 MerR family transcriptional regulator [Curtobacterium sp. MCLR17_036]
MTATPNHDPSGQLVVTPPRRVGIGDAAAFVGTTPRAIRHHHAIGLLPEPERGSDGRRRYGPDEITRLLWIRRMADAGIALADIRDAFGDAPVDAAESSAEPGVEAVLERLERALVAKQAALERQRDAVRRMRARGARLGLLADVVAGRLDALPEGALRRQDVDTLLVTERVFGPLGAAVQASRFIALASDPELRAASDRVDATEAALDDTVDVDDPRVAEVAADRAAFERMLHAAVDATGLSDAEDALFDDDDSGDGDGDDGGDVKPAPDGVADPGGDRQARVMSAAGAISRLPLDFSPARLRSAALAAALAADEPPTGSATDGG